jgi:hypothetical protein
LQALLLLRRHSRFWLQPRLSPREETLPFRLFGFFVGDV